MKFRLKTSVAACALLAASAIAAACAAAPAVHDFNTENGVHAVPSGQVAEQALAPPPGAKAAPGARAAAALVSAAPAPRPPSAPVSPAASPAPRARLVLELADAPAPAASPATLPARAPVEAEQAAEVQPAQTAAAQAALPAPVEQAQAAQARSAAPAPDAAPVPRPALASNDVDHVLAHVEGPEEAAAYGRAMPEQAKLDELVMGAATPAARRTATATAAAPPGGVQLASDDRSAGDGRLGQHVAFPKGSAEAAVAFDHYMRAASRIDAGFKSGGAVSAALEAGDGYDTAQLEEGAIAYGALAALQAPDFVYAVMDAAQNADARRALTDQLLANPALAARLPGAAEAAELAGGAILGEAAPVVAQGKAIKQASYDVQHERWSIAPAADQPARLARAKAASATPAAIQAEDLKRLISEVAGAPAASRRGAGPAFTPLVTRSIALAAVAILGETESQDPLRLGALLREDISASCLKLAKLNLYQCLSAAGPEYEDVYCLGQHAVLDTGQCVAEAAEPLSPLLQAALPPGQARLARGGE